jgi:hypothetical protein
MIRREIEIIVLSKQQKRPYQTFALVRLNKWILYLCILGQEDSRLAQNIFSGEFEKQQLVATPGNSERRAFLGILEALASVPGTWRAW